MKLKTLLVALGLALAAVAIVWTGGSKPVSEKPNTYTKDDEALRKKLTPEQYNVTQMCSTEPPFSGKYWNNHEHGVYNCIVCGQKLFDSDRKFDSGTGWPSFWQTAEPGAVEEVADNSYGMKRIEIRCSKCHAHLGHKFPDGPKPTGIRYCLNSASLQFEKK